MSSIKSILLFDGVLIQDWFVKKNGRRRIVGRPIIYYVIDNFSRLIVGMYVGFEGPSWASAMMALIKLTKNLDLSLVHHSLGYGGYWRLRR